MPDLVYFQAALCPPLEIASKLFVLNPAISSVLAEPVYLVIFSLLGGTDSILRSFLGQTSKEEKEHPVGCLCLWYSFYRVFLTDSTQKESKSVKIYFLTGT